MGFGREGWTQETDRDGQEVWVIQRPPFISEDPACDRSADDGTPRCGGLLFTFLLRNPGERRYCSLVLNAGFFESSLVDWLLARREFYRPPLTTHHPPGRMGIQQILSFCSKFRLRVPLIGGEQVLKFEVMPGKLTSSLKQEEAESGGVF